MLGWGSTFAAITAGVKRVRRAGRPVAQLHLVHLNPFPPNLGEVLRAYEIVIVPENNLGHLTRLVRSDFLVDAQVMSKVQGTPFRVGEIEQAIHDAIDSLAKRVERSEAGGKVPAGADDATSGHEAKEAEL
jgi:2-oxoglutarate ferredoxin oxidoreductase subunit alpha